MPRLLLLTFVVLAVTACSNYGPDAIRASRTDYNIALMQTQDEQMLLNLVRLKYRDRPFFLESSALNTQFTFGRSLDGEVEFGPQTSEAFRVGGRVVVEERPTVTYTPLQGENFVERVLAPISPETLILLGGSGWSSSRVFRACVERMNALPNAPGADGPTPKRAPAFERFRRAADLLRELELANAVAGAKRPDSDVLLFRFRTAGDHRDQYLELMELLGLDPAIGVYPLSFTVDDRALQALNLRTRSFLGVMYFLSQSVEVPEEDVAAGRVTVTRDDEGEVFDWGRVTEGLLRIRSSDAAPDNAAVAVHYRGSWFYIDDSDLDSKSTFSLLSQIFSLQSGNAKGLTPLITIPVGG